MAKRRNGIPRQLLRLSTTDGVTYRYYLECGHVITGPGRAAPAAIMKCEKCASEDRRTEPAAD